MVSRLCSQLEKYGHVPGFIDLYLVNDKYIVGFDHGMEMDAMQNQCIAFIRKDMAQ